MMAVALYFQYALGEQPCQVCIHARLWVMTLTLIAAVIFLLPASGMIRKIGNVGILISAVGLGERSWYLYQLDNGIGDGSCEFHLGMPNWFAVDNWFPSLFEVRNLCSFTPEILFGLTMAESLLILATGILAAALGSLVTGQRLKNQPNQKGSL